MQGDRALEGEYGGLLRFAQAATHRDPDYPPGTFFGTHEGDYDRMAWYLCHVSEKELRRSDLARLTVEDVIREEPDRAISWAILGGVHYRVGDLEDDGVRRHGSAHRQRALAGHGLRGAGGDRRG